jgi:hypothetical protein
MKKRIKRNIPTASKLSVARQVFNCIPPHLVSSLAVETGVDEQARTFSPWSHVVAMGYAQISHSIGLNNLCDDLQYNSGPLSAIRGATPPSRNNLSHANKVRSCELPQKLFWAVLEALQKISPRFGGSRAGKKMIRRLKRAIHVVDSTTIELVADCMDWAKHRRRKAAAKMHLRLDLQSFLPRFALIGTAAEADAKRAREVCADIQEGEIALFDKAYVDYGHLGDLHQRGVIWGTRAKENMQYEVVEQLPVPQDGEIISDELVGLKRETAQSDYPDLMRRVEAWVEVDGERRRMVFLTNQLTWSPDTIVALYQQRWQIEVFFKQIKQTLKLADFLGTSANAVQWQIWMALLIYLLLRYLAFLTDWSHSFSRLFGLIRSFLWKKWDVFSLLKRFGTAEGTFSFLARPEQAYFPGFA